MDTMTIDKIYHFVEEKHPELSKEETLFCFNRLYNNYGAMQYDSSNEGLMLSMLNGCLEQIHPPVQKPLVKIWQPRYRDSVVLVDKLKVPTTPFNIIFTKAAHLEGMIFEIDGKWVQQNCSLDSNGKIPCYAIPMDALRNVTSPIQNKRMEQNNERQ